MKRSRSPDGDGVSATDGAKAVPASSARRPRDSPMREKQEHLPLSCVSGPTSAVQEELDQLGGQKSAPSVALVRQPGPLPPPQLQRVLDTHTSFPRLVVVDLDYTLWPGYVINQGMPLSASAKNQDMVVFQPPGAPTRTFGLFPEARQVLLGIKSLGATLAVASRSPDQHQAECVLRFMGLAEHIHTFQVYAGNSKRPHLTHILKAVSIASHDALFFDDEAMNIRDARKMGLSAHQVARNSGLNWAAFETGMQSFKSDSSGRKTLAAFFGKKAKK